MLTLRKSEYLDDWYVLEKENGRPTGFVCVEGDRSEWIGIANAMKVRESCRHKRCAASTRDNGSRYEFYSPRNSIGTCEAELHGEEIDRFASEVIAMFRESPVVNA
jgi:hypothetical protein